MSPYRSTPSYPAAYQAGYTLTAGPPGFQLADFIRILAARRGLILRIALGVILLAILGAFLLPTKYSSSAVVILDQRKNNVTELSAVLSQLPTDPATLQNQIQILTSRGLASQVIAKLKLYDDPEFNAAVAPRHLIGLVDPRTWGRAPQDTQRIHDRILETFLKHISAEANGLSTAITVYATSSDPRKAKRIADALTQTYVEDQVDARQNADRGTSDWLDRRTNDLARQLMREQQAVQEYKAHQGLNDSAPGNSLVDQQMAAINAQIVQARSDLAEKQATYDRVTSLGSTGDVGELASVAASPVIVQLRAQQADLLRQEADLSSKYGPLHPKLQALQAQQKDIDQKITIEVTRASGAIANNLNVAKAHLASLEASLGQVEHQANSQNMARVALEALQSNADSTKSQYQAFLGRSRQIGDQDDVAAPESRIISPATLPLAPSAPKRLLVIGASIPLGFLLGVLTALMMERLGPLMPVRVNGAPGATIVSPIVAARPRKVAPALPTAWRGPPILAELANAEKLAAAAYVVDYPHSRYAQTMTALIGQLDSREPGAAVVAVTAAVPGESKSAIAVSLARAAAQMGKKTVIVDCDPDQMAMKAMQAPSRAGLYEVLTGTVPLSQALAKDSRSGAYALAMTRRPPSLATMFGSAAMTRLLAVLKEGADLVVLDCARAGAGPEAALLARLGDATLLVARKESLGQPALSKSLALLSGAQAAPMGIIATT